MAKYGLVSGTLKGELFSILLTQGISGMKVSELAKSSPVSLHIIKLSEENIIHLSIVTTHHEFPISMIFAIN